MDVLQDWAAHLLSTTQIDPAAAYSTYSTYSPYITRASSLLLTLRSYALALIAQISTKPDLATIALLLLIVLVSLKILNMLWQTLLFWVRLVKSVVFWGGLLVLGLWMWNRGPDGMVRDAEVGWEMWKGEYGYWKERERLARVGAGGVGGVGGYVQGQANGGGRWF